MHSQIYIHYNILHPSLNMHTYRSSAGAVNITPLLLGGPMKAHQLHRQFPTSYSTQTPLLPRPDSQASVSGCSLHPQTSGSVWHPHAGPKSVPREHADTTHPRFSLTFECHFINLQPSNCANVFKILISVCCFGEACYYFALKFWESWFS